MKKLILASFILYLPFQLKLSQVLSINLINLFLILLVLIFIFNRNPEAIKPKFEKPLIIFLIIWALSFMHTLLSPRELIILEVTKEFKRLVTLILGYFVFSRCLKTKREIQFLFYIFLISIVLVGLHTFRNGTIAGPHFADFKRSSGPFALNWSWRGSDIAGGFLAIFTPFIFAYFLLSTKKILKLFSLLGFIICVLGLLTTYSRGSMLGFSIAAIVVILVSLKRMLKSSRLFSLIILLILITVIYNWRYWMPESVINRVEGTFQESDYEDRLSYDQSSLSRLEKWRYGIEVFKSSPIIGVGFEQAEYYVVSKKRLKGKIGMDVHNAFVKIAAEMGIIGILAFLWFLWEIINGSRSLLNTEYIYIGVGFIGCITAFMVVNMFYANFFRDTVVGSFWSVLGIMTTSKKLVHQKG